MKTRIDSRRFIPGTSPVNLIILSALLVIVFFLLQGNLGLNLADEGFLWYGTIRTSLGDVPIRDFQSYDPGRYYWGALWFRLMGSKGIIALRISEAIFQFLGVSLALLLLRRVCSSLPALAVAGCVISLWMFIPFKIFEPVITIAAVYFAVLLIENPSRRRHLMAGIFVGFAAFFGRNHGLYCFVGFLSLLLFIWWKMDRRELAIRVAAWALGIIIGYSPMLLMLAFVPGLFNSFLEGVLFNIRHGTNLPLRLPWPWVHDYSSLSLRQSIQVFSVGMLFIILPLFYLFSFTLLFKSRRPLPPLFIGCIFIGIAYLHYSFDRAHLYYLAWTIPPFVMGAIALSAWLKSAGKRALAVVVWVLLVTLSLASLDLAPENYTFLKLKSFVKAKTSGAYRGNSDSDLAMQGYKMVKADIAGDHLWLDGSSSEVIEGAKLLNHEFIPENDRVFIAPYWATLYPVLGKDSPLREIYLLFPQPRETQERMIGDLDQKKVNWAIICHHYLDGRPELAFENTHSLVWRYLTSNFVTIRTDRTEGQLPGCDLMHRIGHPTSSAATTPKR